MSQSMERDRSPTRASLAQIKSFRSIPSFPTQPACPLSPPAPIIHHSCGRSQTAKPRSSFSDFLLHVSVSYIITILFPPLLSLFHFHQQRRPRISCLIGRRRLWMNRAAGLAKLGNVFRNIPSSFSFFRKCLADWRAATNRSANVARRLRNHGHERLEVRSRPAITRSHAISTPIPITSRPFIIGQPYLSMNLDKLQTIKRGGRLFRANESLWNDNIAIGLCRIGRLSNQILLSRTCFLWFFPEIVYLRIFDNWFVDLWIKRR